MKKVIIGILALVLVGGGIYVFATRDKKEPEHDHSSHSHTDDTQPTDTNDASSNTEASDIVITYTDSGFNPDSYTVTSEGTVTVRNDSSMTLDFASNDHPAHTDNSELNIGEIAPGASASFVVKAKGTWGFHNHDNDAHTGTLVVQ